MYKGYCCSCLCLSIHSLRACTRLWHFLQSLCSNMHSWRSELIWKQPDFLRSFVTGSSLSWATSALGPRLWGSMGHLVNFDKGSRVAVTCRLSDGLVGAKEQETRTTWTHTNGDRQPASRSTTVVGILFVGTRVPPSEEKRRESQNSWFLGCRLVVIKTRLSPSLVSRVKCQVEILSFHL